MLFLRDLAARVILLAANKSQPLHDALKAGDLHQGLGDGAVLNLLGKRGPSAFHSPEAESVGGVVDRLNIAAHSLGSVALHGLEDGLDLD